jgi:hypothetical protein
MTQEEQQRLNIKEITKEWMSQLTVQLQIALNAKLAYESRQKMYESSKHSIVVESILKQIDRVTTILEKLHLPEVIHHESIMPKMEIVGTVNLDKFEKFKRKLDDI